MWCGRHGHSECSHSASGFTPDANTAPSRPVDDGSRRWRCRRGAHLLLHYYSLLTTYYLLQRHHQGRRGAHLVLCSLLTPYYTAHYSAIAKGDEVRISYAALERGPGAFVQNWGFVDQARLPSYHPYRTEASSTWRRYLVITPIELGLRRPGDVTQLSPPTA